MKTSIFYVLFLLICIGCNDERRSPYGKNDGMAPDPVTGVNVTNINGGAILRYTLPDNSDLLYVKALYFNSRNEEQEVRSSMYNDSLVIANLGDMNEREVRLYAVDRTENISKPTIVKIQPLEPSVMQVQKSLKETVSWGGFLLNYTNIQRADVSVFVYKFDKVEEQYVQHEVFYTNSKEGTFAVRDLPHELNKFRVFVKDKWGNISDDTYFELLPWKEDKLDKSKFKKIKVLDDVDWNQYNGKYEALFDEDEWVYNMAHTAYPIAFPHAFSVDLGVSARISRIRYWQRQDGDNYYAHGAPKVMKMFGCEDGKNPDVEENWTLLYEGEMFKPSGNLFGEPNTAADMKEARDGHEFSMFDTDVYIRYFRFQSLASWSGMECTVIREITLWGDVKE